MSDKIQFNKISTTIGELVINNPKKRNALDAQMWAELPEILQKAQKDKDLKVLIVRGQGDHFASGADISEFGTHYATPESSEKISTHIEGAMSALANFPLPTLAMIRGACVGGGCGLSLCCDIRFADKSSKFAITPAKLGLVYPYEDVQRLIETVGLSNAMDMLFSARILDAKAAKKMGLINYRVKAEKLEERIMAYAEQISRLSSGSNKVIKQMCKAYQMGQFGNSDETIGWFLSRFTSKDFTEGYTAFLEKRKPDFT